jgi:hypothetical protein
VLVSVGAINLNRELVDGRKTELMDSANRTDLIFRVEYLDQKSFAGYIRLFMDLKGTQVQSFLDWCWEKYLEGAQPSPNSTGFGDGNFRFSEEQAPYTRI